MSLPTPWETALAEQLSATRRNGRWRERSPRDRRLLDFASNDYLNLARDPRVAEALGQAAADLGTGAGAAQLLGGYQDAHRSLERQLADFVQRPAAALFSTGYMANLGLVGALTGRGDAVVQDKRNHASLLDGARLSGAQLRRYRHHDLAALERQLTRPARRRLVLVESIYSMDGDLAPLPDIAAIAARHGALLCVDEAHALGVCGPQGAGALTAFGLGADEAPVLVGTFGKSLGTFGAFVAGPQAVIDAVVNHARSQIYTTAPPPALAAATSCALTLSREESWRRERLTQNIASFHAKLRSAGLPVPSSSTPIQPMIVGDSETAVHLSRQLGALHIHAPAVRPPTVREGQARLRITLNAGHDDAAIERLVEGLKASWPNR
ncbi:MAG: 8-amino-7-oxononanoate synthase [Pseudomonadota bacterium]